MAHAARYTLYEYAGFQYRVWIDARGEAFRAEPVEGQHRASQKEKHRRNCIEQFNRDNEFPT